METATEAMRRQRGTKRVCRSCEGRFYDLGRDPTVCPSCKATLPLAEYFRAAEPQSAGYQGSWAKRRPVHTVLPVEDEIAPASADTDADAKSDESPVADDDAILEQDEEMGDVGDLISPDEETMPDE